MNKTVRAVSALVISLLAVAALRVCIVDVQARQVASAPAPIDVWEHSYSPGPSFGP